MASTSLARSWKVSLALLALLFAFVVKDAGAAINRANLLSIQTRTLPAAKVGRPYSSTLQATGGSKYAWSVAPGIQTAGLSLSAAGVLSGTPQSAGTFMMPVILVDATRPQVSVMQVLSLSVTVDPLTLSAPQQAAGTQGQSFSLTISADGGVPGYTWSLTKGSLPAGLSMRASDSAVISGTPTANGTFPIALTVRDSAGTVQNAAIVIRITAAAGNTWYVRPDGGNRYSTNVTNGQCDGLGDAPYPGKGVNQHCAFNDIRLLWQDGSYAYTPSTGLSQFPAVGWIGKGGDTYVLRGSIADGIQPYRVGWDGWNEWACTPQNQAKYGNACHRGYVGDPYTGAPAPPAGTASLHTRILGGNWQNCHAQAARTPVIGGYNVGTVFTLTNSYVDMQCLDLSDQSDCVSQCQGQDSSGQGIKLANTADHLTLSDLRIHGFGAYGILGPSGNGSVFTYLGIFGNGLGGWNADAGDGLTGSGTLLVQHFEIEWNGCAEEYPIVDAVPYKGCRDQSHSGYGDGFGTATVSSNPGWQAHFDQGTVAYNTQDGLDALHLVGNGSSMTVTRVLAYGNMGQQVKIGGAAGALEDSIIVGNCKAMSQPIPGTPAGYNNTLGDFCRAGNAPVIMTAGHASTTYIQHNTIEGYGTLLIAYICDGSNGNCDATALVDLRNNIMIGNPDPERGVPGANYLMIVDNTYTTPGACNAVHDGHHGWITDGAVGCGNNVFYNPGSYNSHNIYYQVKDKCTDNNGTNNLCGDPGVMDTTVPAWGYPDLKLDAHGAAAFQAGVRLPNLPSDYDGTAFHSTPSIGALETNTAWKLYAAVQ